MPHFISYLLKVSLVLGLFYAVYWCWLVQTTHFKTIRFYLLSGILISLLLPLFPVYEYVVIAPLEKTEVALHTIPLLYQKNAAPSLESNVWFWVKGVYWSCAIFLLIKFAWECVSIGKLIAQNPISKKDGLTLVWLPKPIAPFSFFHWVFLTPTLDRKKQHQIIAHEKIHSQQKHNWDILLCQLLTVFLWWNPVVWMYKKALQQNLEFMADRGAIALVKSSKIYQKTLVSVLLQNQKLATVHNFNKSFLKKRILMMKKQQTPAWHSLKCFAVVPLLILFMALANTKVVAQVQEKKSNSSEKSSSSEAPPQPTTKKKMVVVSIPDVKTIVEEDLIVIKKTMTKNELMALSLKETKKGNSLQFSKVKRNAAGNITRIKIRWHRPSGEEVCESSNPNGISDIILKETDSGDTHFLAMAPAISKKHFWISPDEIDIEMDSLDWNEIEGSSIKDSLLNFHWNDVIQGHLEEEFEALHEDFKKDMKKGILDFKKDMKKGILKIQIQKDLRDSITKQVAKKIKGGFFISEKEFDTLSLEALKSFDALKDLDAIKQIKVVKDPGEDKDNPRATKKKVIILMDDDKEEKEVSKKPCEGQCLGCDPGQKCQKQKVCSAHQKCCASQN